MNDNRPIGVFDSGVGGLSILSELKAILPHESFIYFADQAHMPYGGKSKEKIEEITEKVVNFLEKEDCKAIVIACNTATVNSIDYLREKFSFPIIGTVPVVKTIVQKTKTRKTAIFSTPTTAKSAYLSDLISKFSDGVEVIVVGETTLENYVERGDINNPEVDKIIRRFLTPLINDGVDSIALGCTHYAFLKKKIEDNFKNVGIYDSSEAVARQAKRVLEKAGMLSSEARETVFYTTGDIDHFQKVSEMLLDQKLANFKKAGI